MPTIKIASNTPLFEKKQRWIDFDAQNGSAEALMRMILDTVGGKMTKSEENGYREIAIFKNGVTL